MENEFLKDEQCERCKGPILVTPSTNTTFVEDTWDYVSQTVWVCAACGKEHTLDSQPHYAL